MNDDDKQETRPPAFSVKSGHVPRPRPEFFYDDDDEDLGPGWGPSVEVEGGAELFFPWLKKEDR